MFLLTTLLAGPAFALSFYGGYPSASVTLDAVALARTEASVGLEVAADDRDSVLVRGGIGTDGQRALWHAGLEGRRYIFGRFHTGLFLGLRGEGGNDHPFGPRQPILSMGPTFGGKLTLPEIPITVEASFGGDVMTRFGYIGLAPRAGVGLGITF